MTVQKLGWKKTLAADNQFTFNCPIFHAPTKMASCLELRDVFAVGERPPVRRGCQVAMECGKCPVTAMLSSMLHKDADPYGATDTTVRELEDGLLDSIAPVLIREEVMKHYELSAAEITKLRQANENATPNGSKRIKTKRAKLPASKVETAPAITEAAKSGDMTAAVNAEITAGDVA